MTLNRVKLGRVVTFTKYFAGVVSLKRLPKNLIWNKITFSVSNLLKLAGMVVNEFIKLLPKNYQHFVFYSIYYCLI